jgi:predicted nucleotidyltransferase
VNDFLTTVPMSEIAGFCARWKVQELALFGSVLRADFDAGSDVDILVTFMLTQIEPLLPTQ